MEGQRSTIDAKPGSKRVCVGDDERQSARISDAGRLMKQSRVREEDVWRVRLIMIQAATQR